jgi:hypothetical protein
MHCKAQSGENQRKSTAPHTIQRTPVCILTGLSHAEVHGENNRGKHHTEATERTESHGENLLRFSLWLCVSV